METCTTVLSAEQENPQTPPIALPGGTPMPPLCVDLDGTLVKTDTLWETTIANLKAHPWKGFMFPIWLAGGRARLKQRLAEGVNLDCESLPYTPELLDYLRKAHSDGRELCWYPGVIGQ